MHTAHFSQLRGGEVLHNPPVKPRGSTQPPWMETPHPSACCEAKPPPVNRMTDRCKKLPCPKLLLRVVIIYCIYFNHKLSVNQLTHFMYCHGEVAPSHVSSIIHSPCRLPAMFPPWTYPHPHGIWKTPIRPTLSIAYGFLDPATTPACWDATGIDVYVTWDSY